MEKEENYTQLDNVQFKDGDIVEIDTNYFGLHLGPKQDRYIEAIVVGKYEMGNTAVAWSTFWIIEFEDKTYGNYPYRCMLLPVNAIKKDCNY